MVVKTCKICGKEFDARGSAKCCSPECMQINKRNNDDRYLKSDKGKATRQRYEQSEKCKAIRQRYEQSEKCKAIRQKYHQSDKYKEYLKEYQKEYYKNNRDKILKNREEHRQKKIAELNEKYNGDLDLILKECPTHWEEREAIMMVEYGVSYSEVMYKKMELNPVCEVTGSKDNLVIHHLDSFNLHPEKGADIDNLVRIKKEIHDEFHNIYGRGNNTREQWFEFLENYKRRCNLYDS